MLRRLLLSLFVIAAFSGSSAAPAQDRETPYWASLRADKINMRVGPSENYPIDWVYKSRNLPVKVVRLMQGWRLVRDPDGAEGWIVARLLSPDRSAIVIGKGLAPIRSEPTGGSPLRWNAEPGVVGTLGDCENGWCAFDVDGRKGWIEASRLWGAGEP